MDRAPIFTMHPDPQTQVLDFGAVAVSRLSALQTITVQNCSTKVRKFELLLADRDTLKYDLVH